MERMSGCVNGWKQQRTNYILTQMMIVKTTEQTYCRYAGCVGALEKWRKGASLSEGVNVMKMMQKAVVITKKKLILK